jgi:NADPH-dependent glutamate synthase beta subunit-like oxidoreductase
LHKIAIIGSGPAGYYTAEACQKAFPDGVEITVIDRLPVPFGLIRTGVAPDHQSIKAVSRRYDAIALSDDVHFIGNVSVGSDVTVPELQSHFDAVVLATGAPQDVALSIPGGDLPGITGSAAFVGWYNGHPDFAGLDPDIDGRSVAIIGNGNVALDVARILAKTAEEFAGSDIVGHAYDLLTRSQPARITIIGRRGPHQIAMTPKELGELGKLHRAAPLVSPDDLPPEGDDAMLEPGQRKSVMLLREFAARGATDKPVTIEFDFFAMPVAAEGDGRVERLIVERSTLDANQRCIGTGERYAIAADIVISCIGYRTPPIPDVPYEEDRGRFANDEGRIMPGLYCVGWARRGPSGTIGTNKPDGFMVADQIASDVPAAGGKAGEQGVRDLLARRGVKFVTYDHWQKIDQAEIGRARDGAPREKFVHVPDMIAVAHE